MISSNKDVVVASEKEVPTLYNQNTSNIVLLKLEEADKRVFSYAHDIGSMSSILHVLIKTVNNIIATALFSLFPLFRNWRQDLVVD